jgi:exonuclease SbcD
MKILHTSDWHIGHKLYGRTRHQEHQAFLDWLLNCITTQRVETLIVAGDIFHSQTPSNQSLALYYAFLSRAASSCCRHVVVIGGNHDSPTLLNGPRELLHSLSIHVIGKATDDIEDELLILNDAKGTTELMVIAVPYLRDKDIRKSQWGESAGDKQLRMITGIKDHYAVLEEHAVAKQQLLPMKVPIIATGHLFCQGGKTQQGDGVRELYVGTLVQVGTDCFPNSIDYLALGHLHQAQRIGGQDNMRYCGAPLPMSFSERGSHKKVLIIDSDASCAVDEISIPCVQQLSQIRGDLPEIIKGLERYKESGKSIFLEIHYEGQTLIDDLQEQVYAAIEGSELKVLRISNKRVYDHILRHNTEIKTLEDLSPRQVFQQCLDLSEIPDTQQSEMQQLFEIVLHSLESVE